MAKSIQTEEIVEFLKATSTVATVVSDRIYFGEPMREQTGIYIVLNPVSQIVDRVSKQALLEVRILGHDENVRRKQLVDLANLITDAICTTDSNQTYTFGSFVAYKVVESGGFNLFVGEKNRNILIKDYIFYFLS